MKKIIILSSIILSSLNINAAYHSVVNNSNYIIETSPSQTVLNCSLNTNTDSSMPTLNFTGGEDCDTLILNDLVSVNGNVMITSNKLNNVSLPNLSTIDLDLIISENSLTILNLSSLTSIGQDLNISSDTLTGLSLPNLSYLNDSFKLSGLNLDTLNLPKLTSVGNMFDISETNITDLSSLSNFVYIFLVLNKDLTYTYPDVSSPFCEAYAIYDIAVIDQDWNDINNVCQ